MSLKNPETMPLLSLQITVNAPSLIPMKYTLQTLPRPNA
jgi:hypothetical protein